MGKAILGITPEFLINHLGIGKFRILRVGYNLERDIIEFVVEHDLLPETEPTCRLPSVKPVFERINEFEVQLKEIRLWKDGETIKHEDMEPFKTPEKKPLQLGKCVAEER